MRERRERLTLIPSTNSESGLACVAMVASWYGHHINLPEMRRRFSGYVGNVPPADLIEVARILGLSGRLIYCSLEKLESAFKPSIILWNLKRYVILEKVKGSTVSVIDPRHGRRTFSLEEFSSRFAGAVLEFSRTSELIPQAARAAPRILNLLRWSQEAKKSFVRSIGLSLFLQLLSLLVPLYMQMVIDDVIASNDTSLLTILALAFVALATFNALATGVRAMMFQLLSNAVAFDLSGKLHARLFKLPIGFFQRRNLSEINYAFRAVDIVRQNFNNTDLAAMVDGAFVIITSILMLIYSLTLGSVALLSGIIYICIRYYVSDKIRTFFAEVHESESRESAYFSESLRGIQTIKVFNLSSKREGDWRNLYVDKANASFKWQMITAQFTVSANFLSGITDIIIIYIAARYVISGAMTIGVVTAFVAYKTQFLTRLISITDEVSQFNVLNTHLSRASEIAFSETEKDPVLDHIVTKDIIGKIEFRDVTFRYQGTAAPILDKLNLVVNPGEFVAIVGPSGTGKSTFLKLLLGLYVPDEGDILVDGLSLSTYGVHVVRKRLGAVMQEDLIFEGTVADNISLFDDIYDLSKIRSCARLAQFDGVAMNMPLGYDSILGSLGIALSSGQKQRLLIARALYRDPAIIVMDEGTANLDAASEKLIIDALYKLNATRIMVAHSAAIAKAADTVYEMIDGKFIKALD